MKRDDLTPEQHAEMDARIQARVKELTVAADGFTRVLDGARIIMEEFARAIIKRLLRERIIGRRKWESKRKLRRRRWKGIPAGWRS